MSSRGKHHEGSSGRAGPPLRYDESWQGTTATTRPRGVAGETQATRLRGRLCVHGRASPATVGELWPCISEAAASWILVPKERERGRANTIGIVTASSGQQESQPRVALWLVLVAGLTPPPPGLILPHYSCLVLAYMISFYHGLPFDEAWRGLSRIRHSPCSSYTDWRERGGGLVRSAPRSRISAWIVVGR